MLGGGVVLVLGDWVVVGVVEEVGVVVVLVEVVLDATGVVGSPLSSSSVSTSCWTASTCDATAVGVPWAPSAGNAFNCFSAASSFASNAAVGWALSVTTSWSAIAVVVHAGQS